MFPHQMNEINKNLTCNNKYKKEGCFLADLVKFYQNTFQDSKNGCVCLAP